MTARPAAGCSCPVEARRRRAARRQAAPRLAEQERDEAKARAAPPETLKAKISSNELAVSRLQRKVDKKAQHVQTLEQRIATMQADLVTALATKEDLDDRMRDLQATGAALHRQSAHEKEQAQHGGRTEPDVQVEISDVLSAEFMLLPQLALGGSDKLWAKYKDLAMDIASEVHARSWRSMDVDKDGAPSAATLPDGIHKKVLIYFEQ